MTWDPLERATRIRASSDIAAADWIAPRLAPFGERIDSLVPGGFDAYARIFHPAEGPWEKRASWAEVASWSGKTMHPHAEFELLERRLVGEGAGRTYGYEPRRGQLLPDLVVALAEVLGRHTDSQEQCWFCIWDGGWITGPGTLLTLAGTPADARAELQREWEAGWELPFGREALTGPRIRLPGRDYVLLEGPLEAVGEIGERTRWQERTLFDPQSPNLWWPDDRAWCVATEIDLDSTHVGGAAPLIDELLDDPRFEALRVDASDERGDHVNVTV